MPTNRTSKNPHKDKQGGLHDFPKQRVRNSEKEKEEWYIRSTNYIIDRAIAENDKSDTLDNIKAANGDISDEDIEYILQPYSVDISNTRKKIKFPQKIRDIDIITPIKERYMGEYIKQYSNYQVYIHNSDSVFLRNEALKDAVASELVRKFQELLDTGDEEKLQKLDLDKFSREFIQEWTDERVIRGQKRLDLINDLTEADVQYIQAFFYWWATEEVYSYRKVVSNELIKEIVPPWEYYRVDSGSLFIEDDDMGMRKYKMSINQIIDQYRDRLSEEDMIYIQALLDKYQEGQDLHVTPELLQSRSAMDIYKTSYKDLGQLSFADASRKIDVYHCVWKTETLIYKLKYYDFLSGEIKIIEVPQDYKLDQTAGDISLEEDWINESWESLRFGGKYEGLYLPARPVEVQRQEVNNSSVCKLPYNGIKGLLRNNKIKPVPRRLIPYQELIKLYEFQREKTISKFKAFNIIPESLLSDSSEMTMEERLAYASLDDILPINDEDIEPSVLQAIKNLYNQGAERYIQIISEVIESLRRGAMDTANMNEQRYGDIGQQAGKSVTEYAITKATTGSIWMFEMFNKFRERDHMADLDYSKAAWIDGKKGSYIDPNTKQVVYADIDGIEDLGTNWAVFIRNSALEEEKLKMYRELAFNASQNGNHDLAADAIHSENSTEIRRLIKKASEAEKEYQMTVQKSTEELQAQLAQQQQQVEQMKMQHDKELKVMGEVAETERQVMKLEVEMEKIRAQYGQQADVDLPDEYTKAMDEINTQLKLQKQALDEVKTVSQINKDKEKQPA